MMHIPLFFALCVVAYGKLSLVVNSDGSYSTTQDGVTLSSAPIAYAVRYDNAVHTTDDGSLKMDAPPSPTSGTDTLGSYTGYSVAFNGGVFVADFKLYEDLDALLFTQTFPKGLSDMAATTDHAPQNDLSTAFPVFGPPQKDLNTSLAYLTWPECMSTGHTGMFNAQGIPNSGLQDNSGTPLVLYSEAGTSMIISPVSAMMTSQVVFAGLVGTSMGVGHNGMVTEVPAGWTQETLLVGGTGVNNTVMAWGDLLLKRGGKHRTLPDADLVISTLGWWSDNGAYYYYLSEPGKDMQDTVMDATAYWDTLKLPYQHLMYDSWWYWKECPPGENNTWLKCKGAVELWEPRPDVFHDGFDFKAPKPLALHNRWFSAKNNTYITQLGFADSFIVESSVDFALPIRSDVFKYLMGKAKDWGMVLYEQDWLITVYNAMNVTKSNVTAGSDWLQAMADAASELGVTIQYCMPLARHMLESTKHQAVTNARASGDYHPGAGNFDVALSSLLYWAIGIAPSKDDWWTTAVQPGNPYGDKPTEPNWQLQALVVGLSTGPNGPSDGIGFTNASLVMSTVRGDGVTLQPDRPSTTMDAALALIFTPSKSVPDLRSTWTQYTGGYRWHFILATRLERDVELEVGDLWEVPSPAPNLAVFDWFNPGGGPRAVLPTSNPHATFVVPSGQGQPSAPTGAHSIQYFTVPPQLPGGWWLYGEAGKVVPMSKQRVPSLTFLKDGFSASVVVVPGEVVTFLVGGPDGALKPYTCTAAPTSTLACTGGACSCT